MSNGRWLTKWFLAGYCSYNGEQQVQETFQEGGEKGVHPGNFPLCWLREWRHRLLPGKMATAEQPARSDNKL